MNDYLWRASGEKDEEIEKLENVLGTLRFTAKPLDLTAAESIAASSTRLRAVPKLMFVSRRAWFMPVTMAATLVLASTIALVVWRVGRMNTDVHDAATAHVEKRAEVKGKAPSSQILANGDLVNNELVNGVASSSGDETLHNDSTSKITAPIVRYASRKSDSFKRGTRSLVARTRLSDAPTKDYPLASEAVKSGLTTQNGTRANTPEQAAEDLRVAFGITTDSFEQARKQIQARLPLPLFPTTKTRDSR